MKSLLIWEFIFYFPADFVKSFFKKEKGVQISTYSHRFFLSDSHPPNVMLVNINAKQSGQLSLDSIELHGDPSASLCCYPNGKFLLVWEVMLSIYLIRTGSRILLEWNLNLNMDFGILIFFKLIPYIILKFLTPYF